MLSVGLLASALRFAGLYLFEAFSRSASSFLTVSTMASKLSTVYAKIDLSLSRNDLAKSTVEESAGSIFFNSKASLTCNLTGGIAYPTGFPFPSNVWSPWVSSVTTSVDFLTYPVLLRKILRVPSPLSLPSGELSRLITVSFSSYRVLPDPSSTDGTTSVESNSRLASDSPIVGEM